MKNQQTQQSETSAGQTKKRNGGKRLPMAGLTLGIIATAFTVICLMMSACASTSRPSTTAEIAAHKEFLEKLNTAQEEFHQKIAAATKEAEQKSDSIKAAEQK